MGDVYAGLTNVYRTKNYIFRQEVGMCMDEEEGNFLFSIDTYFRRTRSRDAEYEKAYKKRNRIDGERIPIATYVREYVW